MGRFLPGLGLSLLSIGLAALSFAAKESIDYETAHLERRLVAKRATGKIGIDGILSERDWVDAPLQTHFVQNDPKEGEPATFDTEVRFLYDDDNLYFGVVAHDREPGSSSTT